MTDPDRVKQDAVIIPAHDWQWERCQLGHNGVHTHAGKLTWYTHRHNPHDGGGGALEQTYAEFARNGPPYGLAVPAEVLAGLQALFPGSPGTRSPEYLRSVLAMLEADCGKSARPEAPACSACGTLPTKIDANLAAGEKMPAAADGLAVTAWLGGRRDALRCCRVCGAWFHYVYAYEYSPCGSIEDESLCRLTPGEAKALVRVTAGFDCRTRKRTAAGSTDADGGK